MIQGPLSRFGDTAANTGILTLMDSHESTKALPVGVKTVAASFSAACFRIFLMPVDTVKTTMQVTGKFSSVVDKVKVTGPFALYNGSLAAASATFVGHYPWYVRVCVCVWNNHVKKITHKHTHMCVCKCVFFCYFPFCAKKVLYLQYLVCHDSQTGRSFDGTWKTSIIGLL